MKRSKLLRIELANPERKLYCLALIIGDEQVNKGATNARQLLQNVASRMEETDTDIFVASCCSRAGFGMDDNIDVVGKLGHLERLCEAVFGHYGYDLPEYQAVEGYRPITAVHRRLTSSTPLSAPDFVDETEQDAPWMIGAAKSEWR